MKRKTFLFAAGLCAVVFAIGLAFTFSASYGADAPKTVVFADGLPYTYYDGIFTFGTYPQTYDAAASEYAADYGLNEGYHTIDGVNYYIKTAVCDDENSATGKLNDGTNAYSLNGTLAAFRVEPIKWQLYAEGNEYYDIITVNVIDRREVSGVYAWFDSDFTKAGGSFTEYEADRIAKVLVDDQVVHRANLPDRDVFSSVYPSDFAILSNLSNNLGYSRAPYWTNIFDGYRVLVFWQAATPNDMYYTNCLPDDPKIGVRPVIRIYKDGRDAKNLAPITGDNQTDTSASDKSSDEKSSDEKASDSKSSGGGGGGGGGGGSVSSGRSGNAGLPLGIVFSILGGGGMIALFTIWGKKLKLSPDFKPQKWYYIIVIVAVVISITGLSCFAVGLTGGASSKVVGWYGGNMYDVGEFGDRLAMNLTRDGKVYRYIGNPWNEEGSTAVTYHYYRQDGVGTYEYSNGKLTIYAAAEWKLSTWEKPVTVYTDCNGIGSFLKYEGYVGTAYSWYHTNNKDSGGVASILFKETTEELR